MENGSITFAIEYADVANRYQVTYLGFKHQFVLNGDSYSEFAEISTGEFAKQNSDPLNLDQRVVLYNEMKNPFIRYNPDFWESYNAPLDSTMITSFGGESSVEKQFQFNSDKRIVPLPDTFGSYEELYSDRTLFLMFINGEFEFLPANRYKTAIRTATPFSTCSRIMA